MKPSHEVGHILRQHWEWTFRNPYFSAHQKRMLAALRDCRTSALGGHVDACTQCGSIRISYNSCRNRHCPKCQNAQRNKWILARQQELLPVSYFHVVFTIPACLNQYCEQYPTTLYNILFKAAWATLRVFAQDPKHLGAQPGATMVLHTWGQNLMLHPHVHCIVPGGGLTKNGKWKQAHSMGKFLFPVKAMSKVFRAKFITRLRDANMVISDNCYKQCFQKPWVVYAKRPFLGPQQVIEYLGRYTHKIAISNHRLELVTKDQVTFRYKDYRQAGTNKSMSLSAHEFIRRFALHILPHRFVRIRHYGILASRFKQLNLEQIRKGLAGQHKAVEQEDSSDQPAWVDPWSCPHCGGKMIVIDVVPAARSPPTFSSAYMIQKTP